MKPSPTIPILIMTRDVVDSLNARGDFFDVLARGPYILESLLPGFTLYRQITIIADLPQNPEETRPIDLTRSSGDFFTPDTWFFRPGSVLDMALAQPGRKRPQGVERIAFVIEDDIGRIEIHSYIGPIQHFEELAQGLAGFLSGFQAKLEPIIGKQIRY